MYGSAGSCKTARATFAKNRVWIASRAVPLRKGSDPGVDLSCGPDNVGETAIDLTTENKVRAV